MIYLTYIVVTGEQEDDESSLSRSRDGHTPVALSCQSGPTLLCVGLRRPALGTGD